MSIFREFNINMIPGKPPLIIHVSQYESDFVYTFNLVSGKSALAIPETSIAIIRGTKRDGNGYSVEAALDAENHKVVVMGDVQMTACAGRSVFELAIINDEKTICTANFFLDVERAPLDSNTIQSETVLHDLQAIINSAAAATQAAEEASASAAEAAESARTLTIDPTLTQSGQAADSKAVGKYVDLLKCKFGSFSVNSGGHSSTSDKIDIPLEESEVYHVTVESTISEMTYQIWEYDSNENRTKNGGNRTSGTTYALTALSAVESIGIYVGAQSEPYTVNVKIEKDDSVFIQSADVRTTALMLNNAVSGSKYEWAIGTLTPGAGTQTSSDKRIRSQYIRVYVGEKINLSGADKRLIVYSYDKNMSYLADTEWLTGNEFIVNTEGYVRILIRKNTTNDTIDESEVDGLAADLTIKAAIPPEVYTDVQDVSKVLSALNGDRYLDVEIGSINAGAPSTTVTYIRSKDYILANKGDVFIVTPKTSALYYGGVYLYSINNVTGYKGSASFTTIPVSGKWQYTFTERCYFRFRATNASSGANIQPQDLYTFNGVFRIKHMYDAAEFLPKENEFDIDYDTLNTGITGKFNIAIQTDTHMSDYVAYTTTAYGKSDFALLESVVKTVNNLDVDLFANLGDMVRGYQADPDFETRATADKIINAYKGIQTNKAFVIGNHDDGCLFHSDLTYNDNPNSQQVMFPNEQFNRYTKYGLNNKGTSNYFYSDINGVRIITLYQRDYDYSDSIPGISNFKIGSVQINWLVNTALDTDLPVIVLTHAPLVESLHTQGREGFDDVLNALTSFVGGGGTIIAVLSGHTHVQNSAKVDGINHIVFKNGYDFFELISVDLTARTIACKVLNKSGLEDRNFTY